MYKPTLLDASVAFTIGEDYAYYGLALPQDSRDGLLSGYQHGMSRFSGKRPVSNRFIRKWLQIRAGAWRRNRVVDLDVTPEYLERIDNELCPVSGVLLTHATGEPTDWSIDRLNNDGAYAKTNLLVMSTRVNLAKGNMGWERLMELGLELATDHRNATGLSAMEWRKLWRLTAATVLSERTLLARECVIQEDIPKGLMTAHSVLLQQQTFRFTKMSASARQKFWSFVQQGVSLEQASPVQALVAKDFQTQVQRYLGATPDCAQSVVGMFADNDVWATFCTWWECFVATGAFERWADLLENKVIDEGKPHVRAFELAEKMRLDSKGYH
jgi:hypothetical protein